MAKRHYEIAGHAHELTFSCYKNYPFLRAERTCQWLADAITAAKTELDFDVWAYVFMPDHVHLIIRPNQQTYRIAEILTAIKSPVASAAIDHIKMDAPEWLPKITRTRGSRTERLFWQSGGGYDRNITEISTLLKMIDYIHMNPVHKNLVASTVLWKWSSAAWYEGGESPLACDRIPPEWLC